MNIWNYLITQLKGQQLQISPEDFIIVPEIFGYMISKLVTYLCGKIVLCQSGDWVTETLSPWPLVNFRIH